MPSLIPKALSALQSAARSSLYAQRDRSLEALRDVGGAVDQVGPLCAQLFAAQKNQNVLLVKRQLARKGAGDAASLFHRHLNPAPKFAIWKNQHVLLERPLQGERGAGDAASRMVPSERCDYSITERKRPFNIWT